MHYDGRKIKKTKKKIFHLPKKIIAANATLCVIENSIANLR